jgi:hypothetical protein
LCALLWLVAQKFLGKWFQAFYLVGDAKIGIFSLSLMRKLGVNYRTAWLLHNKIMQAMSEREKTYVGTPEKGIRGLDPNTANKRRVVGQKAGLYSGQ